MERNLVFKSLKRTHDMFASHHKDLPTLDDDTEKSLLSIKGRDEYGPIKRRVDANQIDGRQFKSKFDLLVEKERLEKERNVKSASQNGSVTTVATIDSNRDRSLQLASKAKQYKKGSELVLSSGVSIQPKQLTQMAKPQWHAPWKLMRVISGHTGWVRCLSVDHSNEWFATGSNDRMIKIWDLASGKLRLSLTGHISAVRGLEVSNRHSYLFSCGEDKTVKCWDLEYNKVIRHYHGHTNGVYCLSVHPTEDVLATGSRDTFCRLWDIRTKEQIGLLTGHSNAISCVRTQRSKPELITGSHDTTLRCWDIRTNKTMCTLTNHKKSVRALDLHHSESMFVSGAPDNIKQWENEDCKFLQNLEGHNAIINCLANNSDDVLVSGGDNGSMFFWDWSTGYNFQRTQVTPQPGSIDSENGIFAMSFDMSGTRLITAEADKTIKVYKENEEATEETHPLNWRPNIFKRNRY